MTDEEILRGLECCSQDGMCGGCPSGQSLSPRCAENMVARGVDLIKRLQEQIKIQEDKMKEIRTDAIKEFAERLKEKDGVPMNTVDNLVKEMVGEVE